MIKRTLMATGLSTAPGSSHTRKPDNPHFETASTPTSPSGTHWVAHGYVRHGKWRGRILRTRLICVRLLGTSSDNPTGVSNRCTPLGCYRSVPAHAGFDAH
jgi:hypothetical protein